MVVVGRTVSSSRYWSMYLCSLSPSSLVLSTSRHLLRVAGRRVRRRRCRYCCLTRVFKKDKNKSSAFSNLRNHSFVYPLPDQSVDIGDDAGNVSQESMQWDEESSAQHMIQKKMIHRQIRDEGMELWYEKKTSGFNKVIDGDERGEGTLD